MGRLWALCLLCCVAIAGCVGSGTLDDDQMDPSSAANATEAIPEAGSAFTHAVCADDELHELGPPPGVGCERRLTHDSGPAAEVDLAVDPTDPSRLLAGSKDFTLDEAPGCSEHNVWSGVYVSEDAGRTWEHDLLPGHPGDERETALSRYDCGSDPVVAFEPDGTAYYASIHVSLDTGEEGAAPEQLRPVTGYPVENAGLAVTRSLDGGHTWEDPVVIEHREDGSLLDKEWMAIDPNTGQIYVSYVDSREGQIEIVRSDDGGRSWTEPTAPVALTGDARDGFRAEQFAQVGVGPEGTVHLVYWATLEDEALTAVYHQASTDDGQTWSQPTRVGAYAPVFNLEFTHEYRIVPGPDLAVDPADGSVHVAYGSPATDTVPQTPPQHIDVYVASSLDGGETWEAPVRVNDDVLGPQNGQWMSVAEVGPDGSLHVTWLDYRDDPEGQEAYVYYAHSEDEGASFSANERLSTVAFDGEGGYHQSGAGTIGDYMGLAASEQAVHAAWADTRYERNDVFAAIVPAR